MKCPSGSVPGTSCRSQVSVHIVCDLLKFIMASRETLSVSAVLGIWSFDLFPAWRHVVLSSLDGDQPRGLQGKRWSSTACHVAKS